MRKLIKYLHKLSQLLPCISLEILICLKSYTKHSRVLKGNCLELRMHLSKFVCGNMPGFLATFRSRNLLFCLELSRLPPKTRHMRAVLPCIDAALNQTWKVQAVFFKLNCSWQFLFKSSIKTPSSWLKNLVIISLQPTSLCLIHYFSNH